MIIYSWHIRAQNVDPCGSRSSLSALCKTSGPLSQVHEFSPSQHTCVYTQYSEEVEASLLW